MPVTGVIERRLLVTYRADPEAIDPLLPPGLRLQVVNGCAVVGVCLIRLGGLRPPGSPIGLRSESAAHRIAVEGGVFIPRRDTDSLLSTMVGGRLYPGVHHRARFDVVESDDRLHVAYRSLDGQVSAQVDAVRTDRFASELFGDLDAASAFYRDAPTGLSPGRDGSLEGLTLEAAHWSVEPVRVLRAETSYFHDVELDHALLMRGVPVTWRRARRRRRLTPAALS